ncbi:hypothetical protein HOC37_07955, partial [bacterium]|nr:hypothetical protein [bacterium]
TRRGQLPIEPCLKEGEIDPEEFELFLQKAVSSMRHIKDQEIVMVVGNTDGGKSTLLNGLFQCQLTNQSLGFGRISTDSMPELFEIGNEYKSQTIIPLALMEQTRELRFCDCPGFEDDRTAIEKAVSALSTYLVTKTAKSVKTLIVVLPATAFGDQNGTNLRDALKTVNQFLGSNFSANQNSILFVITKARSSTREDVRFAIEGLLFSVTDIEVRQMLKFMLDHLDNIFVIDALDTFSQTQDAKEALFSKIMESRGIARDDFTYVADDGVKNRMQGFISRVLEDTRFLITAYFDLQKHIQRSENRLTVLAEELEEVNLSISKIKSGKLHSVSEMSENARVSEEIKNAIDSLEKTLEDEESEVASFEDEFTTKKIVLDTLNISEELEHGEFIYPDPPGSVANGMDGFFLLEKHEYKFEYPGGNPFTRVDVQREGITHPGVGNLFRVVQVPGGFFRGLFGGTSTEELKTAFQQASVNVHAILHGPYDEFTETKSDPEAGVYEGTYSTLHYGITPKATIIVYGERRHHPEFAVEIKLIREEMDEIQREIDEKKRIIANKTSKIRRLKGKLAKIDRNIDNYLREQGTRKVELEIELRAIQRFLRDEREQASQKKKEIESLQQRFRSVFFLLGCIDVSQVFSIPEASLDAFQKQYTRFHQKPLPMIRRADLV